MKVKKENYYTILGWMRTDLNLKGNELLLFALIYGFSQDGKSEFRGSLSYIEGAIGASRPTVIKHLNNLIKQGLIQKKSSKYGNKYLASKEILLVKNVDKSSKETSPQAVKKLNKSSKENLLNINKDINNSINIDRYKELWNSNCKLSKIHQMTSARGKMLNARIQQHGERSFGSIIQKINGSDFLLGKNNRGWKATFDWVINENNYIKILEGNYDGKKVTTANDGVMSHKYTKKDYDDILLSMEEM